MKLIWCGTLFLATLLFLSRLVLSQEDINRNQAPWVAQNANAPELTKALTWYCSHAPQALSLPARSDCKVAAVQISAPKQIQGAEAIEVQASIRNLGSNQSDGPIQRTVTFYRGIYGFYLPLHGNS